MFRYILASKCIRSESENGAAIPIGKKNIPVTSQNMEREDKMAARKQAPLISQEENIRRALRDYYAKK